MRRARSFLSHGEWRVHATLNDAENDEPSIAISVTVKFSPFLAAQEKHGKARPLAVFSHSLKTIMQRTGRTH